MTVVSVDIQQLCLKVSKTVWLNNLDMARSRVPYIYHMLGGKCHSRLSRAGPAQLAGSPCQVLGQNVGTFKLDNSLFF